MLWKMCAAMLGLLLPGGCSGGDVGQSSVAVDFAPEGK